MSIFALINTLKQDDPDKLQNMLDSFKNGVNYQICSFEEYVPRILHFSSSLLMASAYFHSLKCIDYLLSNNANIEQKDAYGLSIVHIASLLGQLDILQDERFSSLDFNLVDWNGKPPLFYAIESKNLGCVKYLKESKNVDINVTDNFGNNALHHTAYYGNSDIYKYLKESGCNQLENKYHKIPFHIAVEKENFDVVKYLIEDDSSLINYHFSSKNLFHIASIHQAYKIFPILEEFKCQGVNELDEEGNAAIHYAAQHPNVATLEKLYLNKELNKKQFNSKGIFFDI